MSEYLTIVPPLFKIKAMAEIISYITTNMAPADNVSLNK